MSAKQIFISGVAGALLAGCTYVNQRADLNAGGPQARVAAAQAQLNASQATNQNLQDQAVQVDRDIQRNEKRIAAAQTDLDQTSQALASARAKKQVSNQQYSKLKGELDTLNREFAALDLQVQSDRGKPDAGPEVAAKEARLKELERRKTELQQALKLALGG